MEEIVQTLKQVQEQQKLIKESFSLNLSEAVANANKISNLILDSEKKVVKILEDCHINHSAIQNKIVTANKEHEDIKVRQAESIKVHETKKEDLIGSIKRQETYTLEMNGKIDSIKKELDSHLTAKEVLLEQINSLRFEVTKWMDVAKTQKGEVFLLKKEIEDSQIKLGELSELDKSIKARHAKMTEEIAVQKGREKK